MEEDNSSKLKLSMRKLWRLHESNYENINDMDGIVDDIVGIPNKPDWFYGEALRFIKETSGNGPFNDYMVEYLVDDKGFTKINAVDTIVDSMYNDFSQFENVAIFIHSHLGCIEGKEIITKRIEEGDDRYEDVLEQFLGEFCQEDV